MAKFKRLYKISQCYHTNHMYQLYFIASHFKKSISDSDYDFYNELRFIAKHDDPDYSLSGVTCRNKSKFSRIDTNTNIGLSNY